MQQLSLIPTPPRRSHQPYFGGKWNKAPWLCQILNRYHPMCDRYLEPFCGSFAAGIHRLPVEREIAIDLNPAVTLYLEVLRDYPGALINRIPEIPVTNGDDFARVFVSANDNDCPIDQAANFYLSCLLGFTQGGGRWSGGLSQWKLKQYQSNPDLSHLAEASARLQGVEIINGDALTLTPQFDSPLTLVYCDPPYWSGEGRGSQDDRTPHATPRRQYAYEPWDSELRGCDRLLAEEQWHRQLAEMLHGLRSGVAISGYDSALYRKLYADWDCVRRSFSRLNKSKQVECLWLKPL